MTYKSIRWPFIILLVLGFGFNYMFGYLFTGKSFSNSSEYTIEYDSTYDQYAKTQLYNTNDSLPYYLYKPKQEWNEEIEKAKKFVYDGGFHSSTTFCSLGLHSFEDNYWYESKGMKNIEKMISQYDSMAITIANKNEATKIDTIKSLANKISYAIHLLQSERSDSTLKEKKGYFGILVKEILYSGIEDFFIQNGKNKIVYYDTAFYKDGTTEKIKKLAVREIPVRLIKEKNLVLVPISNKYFEWLDKIFYFLSITIGCFFISFNIVMPLKILWNISKGEAFNPVNSKIFFLIAKVILFIYLFLSLLKIITFYSLNHLIPKEIERFGIMDILLENFSFIFCAIAAYILGKAFKKGQTIQEENKLTI